MIKTFSQFYQTIYSEVDEQFNTIVFKQTINEDFGVTALGALAGIYALHKISNKYNKWRTKKLVDAAEKVVSHKTHPDELHKLASHKNSGIRYLATSNPSLSHKTVKKLLKDKDPRVANQMNRHYPIWLRHQGNKTLKDATEKTLSHETHPDELHKLASHKNSTIRYLATSNPNLSHKTVKKLLKDKDPRVANQMNRHYPIWLKTSRK